MIINPGTWSIYSEKDPRWTKTGRCLVGGLIMPQEAEDALQELKELYGEMPSDLRWGYMKD